MFAAAKNMGLEGIVSKRAKAPYRSGPSANWLKTKNYDEIELPVLGIQQEVSKPTMALLGSEEDRHYIGTAAVVVDKLNRDLFWRAVELLIDPDKNPTPHDLAEARPGRAGQVPGRQQRAQTCDGDVILGGTGSAVNGFRDDALAGPQAMGPENRFIQGLQ